MIRMGVHDRKNTQLSCSFLNVRVTNNDLSQDLSISVEKYPPNSVE